ncbi:TPA: hypothetical protein TYI15_001613 [Streptococcus suis]|uniref:hypothetical protein n=1 Tax=Streptococcus suis TaxID=1307 RepID=UPI00094331BD|nr:hypothetical protein [Streptococcus suis]RRN54668.1 hypothetical protein EI218_02155 [Streptococcus suis]HEL1698464.1 hypothetical protein [Streptococcus suis]HEL1763100.1 hypothetical protein [Streptococcus suis]HEL1825722.1 hypothetical protein [Streptococcus suis]HEL1842826.1 hypothetical protein [Streptococcus suis]
MDIKRIINYILASWNRVAWSLFILGVIFSFLIPPIGGLFLLSATIIYFIKIRKPKPKKNITAGKFSNDYDHHNANSLENDKDYKIEFSSKIVNSDGVAIEDYPNVSKFRVNPSGERYDDSYYTGTPYKLRELLLLIWWGKTKNPRKPDSKPPRYFYYDYHLETKKVTEMFIKDSVLTKDDKERIVLTEYGKELYDEFEILWEMHSYKGFLGELPNLDKEFADWDYNTYKANNNLLEIAHLKEIINFNSKMQKQYPASSKQYKAYQQDIERDMEQIDFLFRELDKLTGKK